MVMANSKCEKVPVDCQHRERINSQSGLMERYPALHPAWCSDVQFLPFLPPDFDSSGTVDATLWVETLEMIDADLHWLLQLPHQLFWCQVMYDASLNKLLDSYLQNAPRSYNEAPKLSLGAQDTLRNVHRRIFMVFLRMSTHKESIDHFLTPESFADIIYDQFLFDVPKLMELCTLYSRNSGPLLRKMVANVFEKQPKYHQDLTTTVESVLKLLNLVSAKCRGREKEEEGRAQRLDEDLILRPSEVADIVLCIGDLAATLSTFAEVYPPACREMGNTGLLERIVAFYEATIPLLQQQWHSLKSQISNASYVKSRFKQAKRDLASLVNALLHSTYLSPPEEREGTGSTSQDNLDDFLSAVTAIFLAEKGFLREFEKHFSLSDCVLKMQRKHPNLDETHFEYILSSLGVYPKAAASGPVNEPTMTGASPSLEVLQSLISHVKDLLPHLGEGFIEACLQEYGNDTEAVINHVLEGNLPLHLSQMDQSTPRNGKQTSSFEDPESRPKRRDRELEERPSLLEQRASVFDNDEFDVFRRGDVDLSSIHIGKRYDRSTVSSVLSDKTSMAARERYMAYEYGDPDEEEEGVAYEFDQFDQYNDEYDDTYDSHNVGALDNVSTDELFTVKRLNVKGLYHRQYRWPSDEEEEEDPVFNPMASPFSGPVTLLQRSGKPISAGGGKEKTAGVRSEQTEEVRSKHRPDARPHSKQGGGGQRERPSGEETRARQVKERYKGNRANHNRKNLADKKRNRGLGGPPRY